MHAMENSSHAVWIRGPELRVRWGSAGRPMSNSTFYFRWKKGLIPEAEYPFGPTIPYWRLSKIEELEARAASGQSSQPATKDAAQAQQPTAPKRKPRPAPTTAAPAVVEQPPALKPRRKRTASASQPATA
jgi:hypothetical protein